MTEATKTHFLVWPKGNQEWEEGLELLKPQAEELWNRVHAAVPETAHAPCRTFTVSGLLDGDGASTTAASIAHYAAREIGLRVLLIEADLRRPTIHDLGLCPQCPGLAGVLQQQAELDNVVFDLTRVGFHVLPAGKLISSPSTLVNTPKMQSLLDHLQGFFDCIILDGPPFTSAPEVRSLVAVADATIPVIRSGTMVPEQAAYWIAKIGEYRGRVGAVCLSGVECVLPTKVRSLL